MFGCITGKHCPICHRVTWGGLCATCATPTRSAMIGLSEGERQRIEDCIEMLALAVVPPVAAVVAREPMPDDEPAYIDPDACPPEERQWGNTAPDEPTA